jgi:hypothetical protein
MSETLMKDLSAVTKAARTLKELSGLALLAAFLLSSCCATTALFMKRTDVKVFELGQRIPRNVKILDFESTSGSYGTISQAGASGSESWGSCGYRQVMQYIKRRARARGGDAIAILEVEKPRSAYGCYWIRAFLLDTIDISDWPRIGLTEEEIRRELDARGQMLDDIEGIWASCARSEVMMDGAERVAGVFEYYQKVLYGIRTRVWRVPPLIIQAIEQLSPEEQSSYRVAIIKAAGDSEYPYAAYILDPEIPEWKAGFLKARLRKLPDSSGYEAKWYGSTFQDDLREFHFDETGALKAKVIVELGMKYWVELGLKYNALKYSIEQTLKRIYPPISAN